MRMKQSAFEALISSIVKIGKHRQKMKLKRVIGKEGVGYWFCPICNTTIYPEDINENKDIVDWGIFDGMLYPVCPMHNYFMEYGEVGKNENKTEAFYGFDWWF